MAIGLALSGGGFRASLFHLGVIRRLRAEGHLSELSCIASVSGGSVTAAHLLANWDKYNSSPKDFDSVANELIEFTKFDIRGRIQRRLPFLWLLAMVPFIPERLRISPTHLLAKYYDRYLFRGVCAADVGNPKRPKLLILSTNLSKAGLTCFGRQSILSIAFDDRTAPAEVEAKIIPLAQVVAASSAYPGFFPPLLLSNSDIGAREGAIGKQYFTDAGIFDNLGLYGLRKGAPTSFDRTLVSDAGRSFVPQKETEFGILRTALRAVDIFMFRIRQLDLAWRTNEQSVTLISISHETDAAGASSSAVQSRLENIRTDLDGFSQLEVSELIRHGYYVTAKALASERGASVPPEIPEWDIPPGPEAKTTAQNEMARKLQDSARRRWRIFSARDWMSWVQLAMITAAIVMLIEVSDSIVDKIDSVIAGARAYSLTRSTPEWNEPPPVPIQTVAKLERPTNDGFEVVSDDRVWDLRRLRRRLISGAMKVTGPALLTRISTLIKRDPQASEYSYLYLTAASEFAAWSPDERVSVRLLYSKTRSGDNDMNTYELQLGVSRNVNEKFVLKAQAKTTDAPWDRNNSWIGMSTTDNVPAASMRIIFPEDLPYKRPYFWKYPNDSMDQAQSFDGIVLNGIGEKELLWRVDHPQLGMTYKVQWDWE